MTRSFTALKTDFVNSDYARSFISEPVLPGEVENNTANLHNRTEIARASVQACREWTAEWQIGWHDSYFASLPILFFVDGWFNQDVKSPCMNVTLCSEGTDYEPGAYALALPCHELPEFLTQVYLGDINVHRLGEKGCWLAWSSGAVKATLQGMPQYFSQIPKPQQSLFLLRLTRNISLCANEFCALTRGVSEIKTDSRVGALSEMISRVAEHLILEAQKEANLSELLKTLVEIAMFAGCEYILFDAVQGLLT